MRRGPDAYVITASPAQLGSLVSVVRLGHAPVGSPFDRDTGDAVLDPALR